jgi:hypothetical protein
MNEGGIIGPLLFLLVVLWVRDLAEVNGARRRRDLAFRLVMDRHTSLAPVTVAGLWPRPASSWGDRMATARQNLWAREHASFGVTYK